MEVKTIMINSNTVGIMNELADGFALKSTGHLQLFSSVLEFIEAA
jgi:hypothetical protein